MNRTTQGVGHFKTVSGHFFANCINSFHKTEDLTVILGGPSLFFNILSDPPRVSQSGVELEKILEYDFMVSEDAYGSYKPYGRPNPHAKLNFF